VKAIRKWLVKKAFGWIEEELNEHMAEWQAHLAAKAAKTDNPVDDIAVKEGSRIVTLYLPTLLEFLESKFK